MEGAPSLRLHQQQMLRSALRGKCSVVTAGTGSGKTEAFLLPDPRRSLYAESASWTDPGGVSGPWWNGNGSMGAAASRRLRPAGSPARSDPLPDERARRGSDGASCAAPSTARMPRAWLQRHRPGHRFYFGRYTGQTPVTGDPETESAVEQLRDLLTGGEQPRPGRSSSSDRTRSRTRTSSLLCAPHRRRRDAQPLGHAGRAARPADHELLDAERHAAAPARRATCSSSLARGCSATTACSRW